MTMYSTSEPAGESRNDEDRLPRSVLRDFPDRAIRWLLESPDNVRGLLGVAAPDLAGRFDVTRLRRSPRSFVQESLRAREADCVLRLPFRSSDETPQREVWVYILIEHQSDPDPWMAFRLLSYMQALWESERREQEERGVPPRDRRLSAIIPIVLYTGQRPWERLGTLASLVDFPAELAAFVPRHDSVFFSVSESDPRALTAGGDPLGYVLLLFRLSEAPVDELAQAVQEVFTGIERVARAGELDRWIRLAWIVVGYIRHRRPPEEVDRLLSAARSAIKDASRGREVEVMARTSAEELIEQGKAIGEQIGKEIGKEIGRVLAKRETLLHLMKRKFGPLPTEMEARVAAIGEVARLDLLIERILTAATPSDMGL